jgi:hypothetical protein
MPPPTDTAAAALRALGHRLLPNTVMVGGTRPVIGVPRPRPSFRRELRDPVLGRSIAHRDTARRLP